MYTILSSSEFLFLFSFFFSPPFWWGYFTFWLPKTSETDSLSLERAPAAAAEDVLSNRRNIRDGAVWGSALLLFLFEGPPPAPPALRTDAECLRLKNDELIDDASEAPNDAGPLHDDV